MRQDEKNNIISLEEKQINGKREEELKASMKQQEVPVPDILKPEQIRKRLEEMQTSDYENRKRAFSNKRIGRVWAGVAAGIVLLATVGGSVLLHQNQKKNEMYSESAKHSEQTTQETTVVEPKVDTVNDTYKEAYEVLEQYQQRYYDDYGMYEEDEDTRTLGDTFNDIINGIAENFGEKKYESKESQGEVNYAASDVESADMAAPSADGSGEYNYSQNNVRTEGVEECNIVRTDGQYIYEYDEKTSYIHIYNAKGADTSLVGEINLNEYELEVADGFYVADGILTISGTFYIHSAEEKAYTKTLVYDVKKPAKPKFKKIFSQDGIYEESRMVGDTVYVFSSYYIVDTKIEQQKPESYIPHFEDELVSEKDLYIQPECYVNGYTMISSINVSDCTYIDKKSILGGNGKRYVSNNHIYLLDMDYMEYMEESGIRFLRFTYEDGKISDKTGGRMKGEINDDYSIDEYKGYLRMVTHYYDEKRGDYVNGLFIYDKNLKQTGSVKGIAEGEEIKSARFVGDTAYFVTYRNTDPLFAVDVSNPEKPKVLGYLKIPGFSTYLHPYGDNLMFGFGVETEGDDWVQGLKLSMYDISDPSDIKEIDKLVLDQYNDSEGLYDANALLIDPEKNLIGFSAQDEYYINHDRREYNYDYFVYSYDKKQGFVKRLEQRIAGDGYFDTKGRGLYINDYFYVVTVGWDISTYKMGKKSFQLIEEKN